MASIKKLSFLMLFLISLAGFTTSTAWAHSTGENYAFIDIREKAIEGHFEVNLVNLKEDLKLKIADVNTAESVKQTASIVQKHILENYAIFADKKKLTINFTNVELFGEEGKGFAQYFFKIDVNPMPDELIFENNLFYDNNSLHRGLLLVQYNHKTQKDYGGENTALIFSPDNNRQALNLNDIPQLLHKKDFIWQGVIHILKGYDHILFLVALLLTAVLSRETINGQLQWKTVSSFRTIVINFIKTVTLFTVAHSITLTLAALGLVKINIPFVESMIALSIILVALNNIFPVFNDKKWLLILIFGLFHGLGFATVMAELPFRIVDLVYVMLFFNIGVELGQLAIVAVLLPVLFYLSRQEQRYLKIVLLWGSVAIGLMASYWFVERAFLS